MARGWNAGLHYYNIWNADKMNLNGGYQYNKLHTEALAKYKERIDSLSNDYCFNVLTQSGGINYRYAKARKITLSFGAKRQFQFLF